MDFYAILDQVITLLQQRGKASYRALKLQFKLDDASLDILKDELIKVHQLARDQDGEMLVWTGETAPTQAGASHPARTIQPPAVQAQQAPQAPEAERRQLTVMFCDLVDSTKLSSQLDPEEYREVVRAYQKVCSEVITRFDGHIAQLLGDGLLVYFGYPQAHEDDAQRAVRAGLDMLAAMEAPKSHLQQEKSIQLALRIGIHTGLVVVGAMGGQGRQEQLALGETPNIAARIQGLAAPNTVAISEATYRLAQGYFACEALGAQTLRGVGEPITLYRVLRESGAHNRLDIVSARGLTPLVGREQEVALLLERWAQVKAGHGHVVLLTGDAGIGKSRLVQMLKDHVTHEPHMRWECRSSEYYQNTALFPLVDLFQRLLRFDAQETPDAKLAKLEHALSQYRLPLEDSVPLFAPLLSLSLPEVAVCTAHRLAPTATPKDAGNHHRHPPGACRTSPVLFILEDLHWTDPSTLELLGLLLDQTPTAALLVLLTCRPHFQPAWHHRSYLTEMTVHRLARHQIEQMTTHVAGGKTLPPAVMHQLVERTDGVPLFIEEMTKAMLESGHLQAVDEHYALTGAFATFAIPATLQDSLMARLDHLGTAKAVAQYAAVIGRQYSYAWLHACAPLDAATLQRELRRLVEAELVYQRGVPPQATYTFKHALIQDTAYASLLKSTRQQYHQRIAQVLEAQFPETAEAQPELLAQHYTEAGLTEQAVPYWQQAGQRAIERSAYVEAIAHLRQGLALLQTLPETPERTQREVDMHIALGASLNATKGTGLLRWDRPTRRARQLCQHLDDLHQLFPVLRGLWQYYHVRAEFQTAHALGEQLLTLAQQSPGPSHACDGAPCLGSDIVLPGRSRLSAHALCTGHRALRLPAAPRLCVPLWGGSWCDLPQP